MSEPFLGQIMMVGFNFAPRGWARCDGQLLPISSNSALFSLLGTIYGGDGRTTFALPDLRGRVAIHPGNGPGLSPYQIGQKVGAENVTLQISNLPNHNHGITAINTTGSETTPPDGGRLAEGNDAIYTTDTSPAVNLASTSSVGGGQQFGIRQPSLSVNFIIALQGLFPSRS